MSSDAPLKSLQSYRNINLGTTGSEVQSQITHVCGWSITNDDASAKLYVKFYDIASEPDETDTPKFTVALAVNDRSDESFPNGILFENGLWLRATTAVADNSTAAPGANDAIVSLFYK